MLSQCIGPLTKASSHQDSQSHRHLRFPLRQSICRRAASVPEWDRCDEGFAPHGLGVTALTVPRCRLSAPQTETKERGLGLVDWVACQPGCQCGLSLKIVEADDERVSQ